jgi:hypothetical protein
MDGLLEGEGGNCILPLDGIKNPIQSLLYLRVEIVGTGVPAVRPYSAFSRLRVVPMKFRPGDAALDVISFFFTTAIFPTSRTN